MLIQIEGLAENLCAIAVLSAVAEVMLNGRKGAAAVSLMLSMAGIGAILRFAAAIWERTN